MSKGSKVLRAEDGSLYRMRRGKLVRIPNEWAYRHTTPKTIRQRPSKLVRRGRPKPLERKKVTCEEDVDDHLRRTSKRLERKKARW